MTIGEYLYGCGASRCFDLDYLWGETGSSLANECDTSWLTNECNVSTDDRGMDTVVLTNGKTFDGTTNTIHQVPQAIVNNRFERQWLDNTR